MTHQKHILRRRQHLTETEFAAFVRNILNMVLSIQVMRIQYYLLLLYVNFRFCLLNHNTIQPPDFGVGWLFLSQKGVTMRKLTTLITVCKHSFGFPNPPYIGTLYQGEKTRAYSRTTEEKMLVRSSALILSCCIFSYLSDFTSCTSVFHMV